jgi:hypothetical protein
VKRKFSRFAILLWAYPKAYRERRGEEILSTLLDGAPSLSSFETLRVGADVVAHGFRRRLGIASDQSGGRITAAAALPGMMMAAAVAVVMPLFAQLLPGIHHDPVSFGPDTVIWPGLYILWILGAVGGFVFPKRKRGLAMACVAATILTGLLLPHGGYLQPIFSLLIVLVIPALLAPKASARRSHRLFALMMGGVVSCTLFATAALSPEASYGGPEFYWVFGTLAPYVAGIVILCSVICLLARRWRHGFALALLAVPWVLYPTIDQRPFGIVTTGYLVSIELVCVLGAGLLGEWLSSLRETPEAVL